MNRKKKRRRIEGRKDGRTEVEEILIVVPGSPQQSLQKGEVCKLF